MTGKILKACCKLWCSEYDCVNFYIGKQEKYVIKCMLEGCTIVCYPVYKGCTKMDDVMYT